eukprot:185355-Hanusia_phi.AAC.1
MRGRKLRGSDHNHASREQDGEERWSQRVDKDEFGGKRRRRMGENLRLISLSRSDVSYPPPHLSSKSLESLPSLDLLLPSHQ